MLRSCISSSFHKLTAYLFRDEVRLFELFSALNLLAWAELFAQTPGILQRDSYQGFGSLPAHVWVYGFAGIAMAQLASTVLRHRFAIELRFGAMAFAAGAWTVVAVNFWISGVSTTANFNYSLLVCACAISGAFLAWKSTSYQS